MASPASQKVTRLRFLGFHQFYRLGFVEGTPKKQRIFPIDSPSSGFPIWKIRNVKKSSSAHPVRSNSAKKKKKLFPRAPAGHHVGNVSISFEVLAHPNPSSHLKNCPLCLHPSCDSLWLGLLLPIERLHGQSYRYPAKKMYKGRKISHHSSFEHIWTNIPWTNDKKCMNMKLGKILSCTGKVLPAQIAQHLAVFIRRLYLRVLGCNSSSQKKNMGCGCKIMSTPTYKPWFINFWAPSK